MESTFLLFFIASFFLPVFRFAMNLLVCIFIFFLWLGIKTFCCLRGNTGCGGWVLGTGNLVLCSLLAFSFQEGTASPLFPFLFYSLSTALG
jgi:hypothetical protein